MDQKEVLERLDTSISGLSQDEANARLAQYGPNELAVAARESIIVLFIRQFTNILMIILLVAVSISFLMGEVEDALLILAIVVASAFLGFTQEYQAEKAIEALKSMLQQTTTVMRNGEHITIPSNAVVPGDILVIKEGDRIVADGRLIETVELKVNEAVITGESIPVQKTTAKLPESTSLSDRHNIILSGTDVVYGKGTAVVVATGLSTEFGKIATQVATVTKESTPLETRTREIGRWIGTIALSICAGVTIIAILQEFFKTGGISTELIIQTILFGIALAVAAVPEALPAVVAGSLAIGMHKMAKQNALVRKMAAVETLGCISVICSDKTGTITRGEMTVREMYLPDTVLSVKGEGYNPTGEIITTEGKQIVKELDERLHLLLYGSALCNDARLIQSDGRWKVVGDPTEGALVALAERGGVRVDSLRRDYPRIGEVPFSSDRKKMSAIHTSQDGKIYIWTKGACEVVLEDCEYVFTGNSTEAMTEEWKQKILQKNADMSLRALRVLAIAYRQPNTQPKNHNETENRLVFLGLVGMIDPARSEAIKAIEICKSVGIRPIMITGDHKLTAVAVATETGIYQPDDLVFTGSEVDALSDEEYNQIVERITVYARASPSTKLRIVQALKRHGEIVAMTGDGVNDAPALKQADIGVAMGITGTDVTKEAADLVLADDNFATIEKAIERGRWIYDNIKKYLTYLLQANLVEIIVLSTAVLLGYPLPLLPAQILYINLVTDGLPAIALGLSPPDADIMKRPPRNPRESIFSKDVKQLIMVSVLIQVPLLLFIYTSIAPIGTDPTDPLLIEARTVLFYTFVFGEFALALACRSLKYTLWKAPPHKLLWGSIILNIVLTIVLFGMVPGVTEVFEIAPLHIIGIETIIVFCVILLTAVEGLKMFNQWSEKKKKT